MVVEADESDGSFNKLPATVAIVTNIDREHIDYYSSFLNLKELLKDLSQVSFLRSSIVQIQKRC